MSYAELQDVEAGFRVLSDEERSRCTALLSEAALIIDAYNADADVDRKWLVSCRMVRRQLGTRTVQMPSPSPWAQRRAPPRHWATARAGP